ncbi:YdeI/OmpD-associated family protein [Lewinella sp. JB7]|uniref:YdeI/OmpD-associated family protein n=1 Tax=Lewinella sp. JB7 TaxID=2962887 RepID=UPI0020C95C1A|nr:YdeI/OmpD-associated family protein [Lewinella sp. JB7]MCP9236163.1 YdeI/OmpD-associated family protein [Lewinella sp. JB7]
MSTLTLPLTKAADDTGYGAVYFTVLRIPATAVREILDRPRNANRVICRINGEGVIHRGLLPDGHGDYFLLVSKEVRQQFGLEEGDVVSIELSPDDSDYGIPLPPEAAELWEIDPEAREVFHDLTPGKQRNLLLMIDKLKRPDSRARKAVQIHEYLKHTNGKLDYRELNTWMKEYGK